MPNHSSSRLQRFSRFSWGLLVYMILSIVWGVFLRATGSGDGCGAHWPLCDGVLIPASGSPLKAYIESIHRISTEFLGILVLGQLVWAFRIFPRRHIARLGAVLTLVFTGIEGWLGAKLVLLRLVAYSESPERIYWFAGHSANTFCLVAALAFTAWSASGNKLQLRNQGPLLALTLFSLLATIGLSISGSISALGDQLYPASSHLQVVQTALLPTANTVMKARPAHPYMAVVVAMLLSLAAGLLDHLRPSPQTRRFAYSVWIMLSVQMVLGLVNVGLLAPIWMQLLHLLTAVLLWLTVVLLALNAMVPGVPQIEVLHVPQAVLNGAGAGIKDYVALTKPRVISLLLFTTLTAMFIAAKGWPGHSFLHGLWLLIATGSGLYAAAGSSNAINMVCERDLDVRMERTASRPTVTEKIHPRSALWFAFGLEIFSFGILWLSSNLLAATMALAGLVVYVIVYTLLLKRRTWSNIVIGGAAGAFPPLVGYAAAAGELNLLAWTLFALIFVWTPVHFWALAILIKDDYAKAGVPMLPVVKGDKYTVLQIGLYGVVTIACSFAPLWMGMGLTWVYGVVAIGLNAFLLRGWLKLYRHIDRPNASALFHYSMIYLALLFLAMSVDKSGRWIEFFVLSALGGLFYYLRFSKKARPSMVSN
ncbi:protoheme IX farnesyltransferase [Abditibacterium utsteinense]|uniref:Protoheme IX farnesyltransferase n=1 Tax=Abditibacterium utsteinense TaxID=1960156 RepID=A0A2S8SV21_9BACT|nr:heme o synthase [Abditibacterium utsteinense]PQV64629.1 protoheme IX farnesyltransferase [Abditibacterium utsteinense]